MGKFIRILISILAILSFVLLARNESAWAANAGADASSSQSTERSISPDRNKPCDKDAKHGRRSCEDDDDDHGTVKPPRRRVKVCKLGTFSVGGSATVQIKRLGQRDCVIAFTTPYDPGHDPLLPPGTTALTDVLSLKLPRHNALVKLCFAIPPGGSSTGIYAISHHKWEAVSTSRRNGTACTETSRSGTYILLRN